MKYSFTLKDNNQKAYYLFTWFLFFLHVTAAAFTMNSDDSKVKLSMYILLGFYAVIGLVYYLYRKHNRANETFSLLLALFYGHFWLQHAGIIAMLIFAAVYVTVTLVKGKRTTVLITGEGIHLTRMFKTATFPWSAMENVILKDNLLTMDFTTNKIIQVEIMENSKMVDETEFNRFCDEQMKTPSAVFNPDGG